MAKKKIGQKGRVSKRLTRAEKRKLADAAKMTVDRTTEQTVGTFLTTDYSTTPNLFDNNNTPFKFTRDDIFETEARDDEQITATEDNDDHNVTTTTHENDDNSTNNDANNNVLRKTDNNTETIDLETDDSDETSSSDYEEDEFTQADTDNSTDDEHTENQGEQYNDKNENASILNTTNGINEQFNKEAIQGFSDEETVVGGVRTQRKKTTTTRVTLKLQVTGKKNIFGRTLGLVKEFFTQAQKIDKWIHIAPWYDETEAEAIITPDDLNLNENSVSSYFPRFVFRQTSDKPSHDEYVKINLGHFSDVEDLLVDLGTWFQKGKHSMYIDMLQAERTKEVGFFTNSFFTMDLTNIQDQIEPIIGCSVGLRWKPIAGTYGKEGKPVKALHVEVDTQYYHKALKLLSHNFGKGTTGFQDGRKMRFFVSLRNAKSAQTKAVIKRAIERQKFFEKEVKRDYFSDILHLDVIPRESKLPSMRTMITSIKSIQFPHLQMIHSVDETWEKIRIRGDYTYLVMPHIEEEAALMMNNLLPFLRHEYGDGVLQYFTSTAQKLAKDDLWDPVQKRIICAVDTNAEMDDEEDPLGFDEAKRFIDSQKAKKATSNEASSSQRPDINTPPKSNMQIQQEALERVNAITNAAEAAFYKDDDSISTLGSIGINTTAHSIRARAKDDTTPQTSLTSTTGSTTSTPGADNDDVSTTSSITMATFNNLQAKVEGQDSKLNHIELMLAEISKGLFQGKKDDQPSTPYKDGTAGSTPSTPGTGS